MYRYMFLFIFLFVCSSAKAQVPDTSLHQNKKAELQRKKDSVTSKPFKLKIKKDPIDHPDSTHSPHTAVMRSLIFPGWGQIYNGHGLWWRLPALYTGFYFLF